MNVRWEDGYEPQSGRGRIGWCWLGHAAPIGFTDEQLEEMPLLRAKVANRKKDE
jgi:hypothetical protein